MTRQVVAFLRRRIATGEVLGEEPLDLPPSTLRTKAVWWTCSLSTLSVGHRADSRPCRRTARSRACVHRIVAAVRHVRPMGHRWGLDSRTIQTPDCRPSSSTTAMPAERVSLSTASPMRGRGCPQPGRSSTTASAPRMPVVHSVTQVRERQRPAGQGWRRRRARPIARITVGSGFIACPSRNLHGG